MQTQRSTEDLLRVILVSSVLIVGSVALNVFSKWLCQSALNKAIFQFKNDYLVHLQKITIKELQNKHSSYWTLLLENDIQQIETFLGKTLLESLTPIITGIVCIIAICFSTWQIGILVLVIVLCNQFINRYFEKKQQQYNQEIAENNAEIKEQETDMLVGEETIRVYQYEKYVLNQLDKKLEKSTWTEGNYLKVSTLHGFLGSIFGTLTLIAPIAYGMLLISTGAYTVAQTMFSIQLSGNVGLFLGSISSSIESFSKFKVSYRRIKDAFELEVEKKEPIEENGEYNCLVKAENWSVTYEDFKAVDSVNFEIERGKHIAIVGQTGSGKSSLLKGIKGLADSSYGIHYGFENNRLKNTDIIYVPQNVQLFEGTFLDNLTYWKKDRRKEAEICCGSCCINEFVKNQPQGFETIVKERGKNLSGGQRQRLAIARALIKKPKLLLMDEATSAIDKKTEELLLHNIATEYPDMTVLHITHRMENTSNMDEIWVMEKGKIIAVGTHQELLSTNDVYRNLYFAKD